MAWTNPRTWVAGETVTASLLNTHVRDNLNALGTWQTYTPSLTNLTLGNGTRSGRYMSAGKTTMYRIEFTFGSTSAAGGGSIQFGLPFTVAGAGTAGYPIDGLGWVFDTSATGHGYYMPCANPAGTEVQLRTTSGTLVNNTTITWATGDRIVIVGSYEAA